MGGLTPAATPTSVGVAVFSKLENKTLAHQKQTSKKNPPPAKPDLTNLLLSGSIKVSEQSDKTEGTEMKALILKTNNTVEVEQDTEEFVSYATLSRAVGGMIEAVTLPNGLTLWVNEEGKMDGLPVNEYATNLMTREFGATYDIIVGNAIVTGGADDEGETLGLTDEQVAELVDNILHAGSPS